MNTTEREDKVNLRILHCLAKHGRMPYAKIADTLRLSPNAVRDRILSMERRGVIRSYHAVADEARLGRSCHVLALLHGSHIDPKVLQEAKEHPSIVRIHECTGRYSIMVEAVGRSAEDVDAVLSDLLYRHGHKPAEYVVLGHALGQRGAGATVPEATPTVEVAA